MRSRLLALSTAILGVCTALAGADILVASQNDSSIKRFDSDTGAYLGNFVGSGAGGLSTPSGMTYGADGHLYVADGQSVRRYNGLTGEAMGDLVVNEGNLRGVISDLRFHNGQLYVTEWNNATNSGGVSVLDASTGAFVEHLVSNHGRANSIIFDDSGEFFVSDFANSRVRKYDTDGNVLQTYSASRGGFTTPMGLRIGADGLLYVGHWSDGTIRRFNIDTGAHLGAFATGLNNNQSIEFLADGSIIADDFNAATIYRFDGATGAALGAFASDASLTALDKMILMQIPAPGTGVVVIGFAFVSRRRRRPEA